MAAANLEILKLKLEELGALPERKALDVTDGGLLKFGEKDEKTLIIIENTTGSNGTLKISRGDSFMGAASDLELTIPGSTIMAFNLDSGHYIQTKGTKKGCIEFKGPATLKIASVVLP